MDGADEVIALPAADEEDRASQWDAWFVSNGARRWRAMEGNDGTAHS